MKVIGSYDGTKFYNPANKYSIINIKSNDPAIPPEVRTKRWSRDGVTRFVAVGYDLPRTDAVELELEGEWVKSKYGTQLQVEQWCEIIPQTTAGVLGYLSSGLIKGIGPKLAADIVARFGLDTLNVLESDPDRLLEIKGITPNRLTDIKTSYAESRALRDVMSLLGPFKVTPKTALRIYEFFGPGCVEILQNSPYERNKIK